MATSNKIFIYGQPFCGGPMVASALQSVGKFALSNSDEIKLLYSQGEFERVKQEMNQYAVFMGRPWSTLFKPKTLEEWFPGSKHLFMTLHRDTWYPLFLETQRKLLRQYDKIPSEMQVFDPTLTEEDRKSLCLKRSNKYLTPKTEGLPDRTYHVANLGRNLAKEWTAVMKFLNLAKHDIKTPISLTDIGFSTEIETF